MSPQTTSIDDMAVSFTKSYLLEPSPDILDQLVSRFPKEDKVVIVSYNGALKTPFRSSRKRAINPREAIDYLFKLGKHLINCNYEVSTGVGVENKNSGVLYYGAGINERNGQSGDPMPTAFIVAMSADDYERLHP